jgi:phosphoadenosine phosphosulfate reductase
MSTQTVSFKDLTQKYNKPGLEAEQLLDELVGDAETKACLTSSFQIEDMVVLHLLRQRRNDIPVIFLDTGYHFRETYEYRDRMVQQWSINLVNALPEQTVAEQESAFGILHQSNPTQCCQLRKVQPLAKTLQPYDLWFTGLRREQSPSRANLQRVEQHRLPNGKELLKVSLLADWDWQSVWGYAVAHNIEYLPLYDTGYRSIGCEPCTAIPDDPSNPRAGRWGGKKLECGIHTFSEAKS